MRHQPKNIATLNRYHHQFPCEYSLMKNEKLSQTILKLIHFRVIKSDKQTSHKKSATLSWR